MFLLNKSRLFLSLMLTKKGYFIHFARLFFSGILLGVCSLLSHLWNVYQPLHLDFQLQRCQSSIKSPRVNIWNWLKIFNFVHSSPACHLHIKEDYPLNINKFIGFLHSIILLYFVYHLIRLSLFHAHLKQYQEKQHYYAHLYRQDEKKRCSNRLLKT
jgi:hypothetical protein